LMYSKKVAASVPSISMQKPYSFGNGNRKKNQDFSERYQHADG